MSGGAVFDEEGTLCGIISRSFDVAPGQENISYASLLWPSVATQLGVGGPFGGQGIYELARAGEMQALGIEAVKFVGEGAIGIDTGDDR